MTDSPTGGHPDLHVITKELARFNSDPQIRNRKLMSIPVEVLRDELIARVYIASKLRHRKVFIVDEAELLAPVGQNVLLKTLEEPPEGTFLILVTSSEDRLLITVRSRCQRVAFVSLPDEVIASRVDEAVRNANEQIDGWNASLTKRGRSGDDDENDDDEDDASETPGRGGAKSKMEKRPRARIELTQSQRATLLEFADGSLGRLALALRYDIVSWSQQVFVALDEMSRGRYPTDLGPRLAQMIDDAARQRVQEEDNASKEAANKQAAGLMWSMIGQYLRRRIRELSGSCDPSDPVTAEAILGPWLRAIDAIGVAESELASNVNMALVADHVVSKLYRALRVQGCPA
jgi:DNA polymerase-3 subunit delta'